MFAHKIVGFTGPDDVLWTEVAEPAADDGVIIDVVAAGVSFADLLQTMGAYQMKVPVPYTPGMDAAGVVRSAPPGVGLVAGQRVAVLLAHGCWQEVIGAPAERVLPLPEDMGFEAAAATPLNYLTGLFALVRRARAAHGRGRRRRGEARVRLAVRRAPRRAQPRLARYGPRPAGRTGGRHRGRPGRGRPDDRQLAHPGTGRPAARPGVQRRRDSRRQGEPAPAGQHRRAGSRLPGVLRAAAGHDSGAVGPAD